MAIDAVLEDLNDVDAVTFSRGQILRFLNEGLFLIQSLNPAYFAEVKVFKLDEGSRQDFCECQTLVDILGQTTPSSTIDECTGVETLSDSVCDVVRTVPVLKSKDQRKYGSGWSCGSNTKENYLIESVTVYKANGGFIIVNPPVPPDTDVYLSITCSPKIEPFGENHDFEGRDYAALIQWALFRATLLDAESDSSLAVSNVHLRTFADLTSIQLRALKDVFER